MDIQLMFKLHGKRALSTVIATVLLILLVLVTTTIVWTFVKNMVTERTEGVQECFEAQSAGKVVLNNYYTCYNKTTNEVQFSINIGDIDINALVVLISTGGESRSFTITNNDTVISNLKPYKGEYSTPVKLPGKNEGKTYVAGGFGTDIEKVDWIKLSPIVGTKQCGSSDEDYEIASCALFE